MPQIKYSLNAFEGAVIDSRTLPDETRFALQLENMILDLQEQQIKVIWLNIPIHRAELVPPAVAAGFSYHHADSEGVELTRALRDDSFIPPYATHYIGAGGVVLDEKENLLIIKEKYNSRRKPHFKLPGGALEEGEHISTAVCREVMEETGIRTEFQSLACLRHWHGYRYGKSDIYFVCRLTPLNHDITIDPEEISEALWMPVGEYLNSPETHPFNRNIVISALKEKGLGLKSIEGYGSAETHEFLFSR